MYRLVCALSALLLISCKSYVRQSEALQTSTAKDLILKLVPKMGDSALATLVVCYAQNISRGEAGGGDYDVLSLYHRDNNQTCFYTLQYRQGEHTPYYFTNPTQAAADSVAQDEGSRRKKLLLLSGAVVVGIATVFYMRSQSRKLLEKIKALDNTKREIMGYSQASANEMPKEVIDSLRRQIDDTIAELPDEAVRNNLEKHMRNKNIMNAVGEIEKTTEDIGNRYSKAQSMLVGSLLGMGALSAFAFVDELRRGRKERSHSALEELFLSGTDVAVNDAEMWHILKSMHSHLPVRINPDLKNLRKIFNQRIGGA